MKKNGMGPISKKDLNADYLIPRTLFSGFYGPPPDRVVNLFLTDVIRISYGTFGVVYRASLYSYPPKKKDSENKPTTTCPQVPTLVAVKRVLQDKRYKNRELEITRILDHPNIVSLKYYFKMLNADQCYLGLIMEFMPFTFYALTRDHIGGGNSFSEPQLKSFAHQILLAMDYIHTQEICHRDVKPQNILVDETKSLVKICDFGSAKRLVPSENNVAYICSRHYRAPELILGNSVYTTVIDIWAVGCVLAEAVTGHTLFAGQNSADQLTQIITIIGSPDAAIFSKLCVNLSFKPYINVIPKTLKRVINCKYPSFQELIEAMLIFSPDQRPSSSRLLSSNYFSDLS